MAEHEWRSENLDVRCAKCGFYFGQLASCPAEPQAEGATAPKTKYRYDKARRTLVLVKPEDGDDRDDPPAKAPNKPAQHVPSIGHALQAINRPVTLVGALWRYGA